MTRLFFKDGQDSGNNSPGNNNEPIDMEPMVVEKGDFGIQTNTRPFSTTTVQNQTSIDKEK